MKLDQAFPNRRHVLLVAAHVDPRGKVPGAVQDVATAKEAGADGAFLINHGQSYHEVLEVFELARERHPDFFLGVNFLDLDPYLALKTVPASANGFWFDESRIDESKPDEEAATYLRRLRSLQQERRPDLLFLPCVAMKGDDPTEDLARVARQARLAAPFADVVMTSGKQTGKAPPLEKLRTLVQAAAPTPGGNCSGTAKANVAEQKAAGVRVFIVSSSILNSIYRIDDALAFHLANAIHA